MAVFARVVMLVLGSFFDANYGIQWYREVTVGAIKSLCGNGYNTHVHDGVMSVIFPSTVVSLFILKWQHLI